MCVRFRTDGYIVCEEFEEILRAAWVEEQELQKQKEKEVCADVYFGSEDQNKGSFTGPHSFGNKS